MAQISVSNLTFAYEGTYDNVFDNVSFQFDTDWKLGFTGRNGRGKTTFLNLLMGKYEYEGKISGEINFDYFSSAVPRESQTRLGGDRVDGVCREVCVGGDEWRFLRELSLLGVCEDVLDRPFGTLSNGEQTKVMLAALFSRENNFLLIDEPTNHLDAHGRRLVSRYLAGKKGYILVSHDRAFLDGCVDHILSINRAGIEVQRGNFSSWLANKEKRDGFELAENARLKKDIKRLQAAARQSSRFADKAETAKMGRGAAAARKKGHDMVGSKEYQAKKSLKMQQRRKNLERRWDVAIEEKSGLLKNIERADALKISQLPFHTSRFVELRDVAIFYDGGEKAVCRDVNFTIERGDRIALCGRNGSGKSSILKLICGGDFGGDSSGSDSSEGMTHIGEISKASGLKISYVSQDTSHLAGDLSDFAAENAIDESLFKAILHKLDFSRVQFEKDMQTFSGGQKKKTLLAKSLCEKSHLLVWDEPLNFVDVLSRMQIEELLLEHTPTILFVEHDSVFCERIAAKVIQL